MAGQICSKAFVMIIYMYRGNGYLTLEKALEKKRADKDVRYKGVGVTPMYIPVSEIIKQRRNREKD